MVRKFFQTLAVVGLLAFFSAGCASSQIKARKDLREKNSQSSRLYCDFVNGDIFPDVEVQLNLEMAKRCDSEKSFTATAYRTSNENMGIVYCCALHDEQPKADSKKTTEAKKIEPKTEFKPEVKKTGSDELGD